MENPLTRRDLMMGGSAVCLSALIAAGPAAAVARGRGGML